MNPLPRRLNIITVDYFIARSCSSPRRAPYCCSCAWPARSSPRRAPHAASFRAPRSTRTTADDVPVELAAQRRGAAAAPAVASAQIQLAHARRVQGRVAPRVRSRREDAHHLPEIGTHLPRVAHELPRLGGVLKRAPRGHSAQTNAHARVFRGFVRLSVRIARRRFGFGFGARDAALASASTDARRRHGRLFDRRARCVHAQNLRRGLVRRVHPDFGAVRGGNRKQRARQRAPSRWVGLSSCSIALRCPSFSGTPGRSKSRHRRWRC